MLKRTALLACLAVLGTTAASARTPLHVKLHFGLLAGGSYDTLRVVQETTVIPLRVGTKLPYYGLGVHIIGPEDHHVKLVVHKPAANGRLAGGQSAADSTTKTFPETVQRFEVIGFSHTGAGPLGHYTIDVIIDDKPWKTLEYDLVADTATAGSASQH